MFDFFKKSRISKYHKGALTYIYQKYEEEPQIRFSKKLGTEGSNDNTPKPKFSRELDGFNSSAVSKLINTYRITSNPDETIDSLGEYINRTFVDEVIRYIIERNVKDSAIYKAADIDRRLFSKMMSDRYYKPSKDTAISIAFALCLSLNEAKELLERAGYSLSHSNKRDIIIEYFFAERVYKITDINEVLYGLGEKTLGK